MNYEDTHVIAFDAHSVQSGVKLMNETEFAHLLLHIVPDAGRFWFVCKADSGLKARIAKLAPGLTLVS